MAKQSKEALEVARVILILLNRADWPYQESIASLIDSYMRQPENKSEKPRKP